MTNLTKYKNAFMEALGIEEGALTGLKYQDVPEWDSVGHMGMITLIEDAFDIMMEIDDIIDFSSFEKGMEILAKYGVDIS